jgi:DNA-binding transcriptional regulator YhcF (GntR family)
MLPAQNTEYSLVDHLLKTLRTLPDVHGVQIVREASAAERASHARIDAVIDLCVAGKSLELMIEANKSLYPRDARNAFWVWTMKSALAHPVEDAQGPERLPMLIATSISPGAKEFLRHEGVGYFDSGGSLFVPAKGAYLYIDKPPPKALAKAIRNLYSGRRAQILHALLNQHDAWVGVKALAEQAHVSPATASQVLTELERFDWLDSEGQGPTKKRRLREPAALLDAWSQQIATERPRSMRRFYVPGLRAEELADKLAQALEARGVDYAIIDEVAAQRYAPFLSTVSQARFRLFPGPGADAALADLNARPVSEGANLSLIDVKSPDELLFRQKFNGVWLASPIQVYLGLLRTEGRAKDLAAHLRRERIGF